MEEHPIVISLNGAAARKAPPKEQTALSGLREGGKKRSPTVDGQLIRPPGWGDLIISEAPDK